VSNGFDVHIRGGSAVLPGVGRTPVDIYVADGRIAALVDPRTPPLPARDVLQAENRVIVPGVIDAHVHLGQDIMAPRSPAEVSAETASAVAGGVTSVLVYLMSGQPYEPLFDSVKGLMDGHSHVDFGFHFCVGSAEHVNAVPKYVAELGVSSFKFFMSFRGEEGGYLGLPGNDDGMLFEFLKATADSGAMANPHAENIELIWRLRREIAKDPGAGLADWCAARPDYAEAEAEQRVAYLASVTGASVYAVHVTCAAALEALMRQRERFPNVFIETCPHYLTLDTASPVGSRGKVNPPLRTPADRDRLWRGIVDGTVDVIGSDHVPRHYAAKDKDLWSASAGFPGTGTLLPLLVTEGHLARGIPLERLVEVTATRPAQLFGLYPRKGVIRVGSDADLAILDLQHEGVIDAATQHSGAGYSVWEGWPVRCRVETTLVRGRLAVRDGVVSSGPGGSYLPRASSGAAALSAAGLIAA
jgi:dihydropyrimidinase